MPAGMMGYPLALILKVQAFPYLCFLTVSLAAQVVIVAVLIISCCLPKKKDLVVSDVSNSAVLDCSWHL